jgi:hypothetical protein
MAPLLNQEIGIRRESDVTSPAVQPEGLEAPISASLPRNAAGQQRSASRAKLRIDWMELSTIGLAASCAVLAIYRLLWAIHI